MLKKQMSYAHDDCISDKRGAALGGLQKQRPLLEELGSWALTSEKKKNGERCLANQEDRDTGKKERRQK